MCDREYSWEEVGYRDAHSSYNDCSQFHVVVYIFEFNDKNLEWLQNYMFCAAF